MMAEQPQDDATESSGGAVPPVVVVLLVALVTLVTVAVAPPVVEQLLLGWFYFPFRVLPRLTVEWPTVVLGLLSMGLFIAGMHRTLQWFVRPRAEDAPPRPRWSLRSTVIVATGLWVLFGAGTAMVAATHQAVWLLSGRPERVKSADAPRVLGVVSALKEEGQRQQFGSSQRTLAMGIFGANDVYGLLPPGGTMTSDGRLMHGWVSYIAPYLNLNSSEIDYSIPWNQPPNDRLFQCAVPEFLNPAIPEVFDPQGYGLSHVAANVHVMPIVMLPDETAGGSNHFKEFARLRETTGRPLALDDITDGAGHTILLGEVATRFKPWAHPANVRDPALGVNRSSDGFGSRSTGGEALFLMCDGSVRNLSAETDPSVMRALATPAANDDVPVDF